MSLVTYHLTVPLDDETNLRPGVLDGYDVDGPACDLGNSCESAEVPIRGDALDSEVDVGALVCEAMDE